MIYHTLGWYEQIESQHMIYHSLGKHANPLYH
jgi:hypothetical protein